MIPLRRLAVLLAVCLALGLLGFLLNKTLNANAGIGRHQLRSAQFDAIAAQAAQLEAAVDGARFARDAFPKLLADSAARLAAAETALGQGETALAGLSPEVDAALQAYLAAANARTGQLREYQAWFSAYRAAWAELDSAGQRAATARAEALITQVESYVAAPNAAAGEQIARLIAEFKAEPEDGRGLASVGNAAIAVLSNADRGAKLAATLRGAAAGARARLESTYDAYYQQLLSRAEQYRVVLVVYVVALLAAFGVVGFRLRQSFGELDQLNMQLQKVNTGLEKEVEARTRDLRKALDDLRLQQAHLIQSEKMASLGQMVAGVAHEINTPLGYARSNVAVVRETLPGVTELFQAYDDCVRVLGSGDAAPAERDRCLARLAELRSAWDPGEGVADFDALLGDADHGFGQIAELVKSLKDFSRVDRSRTELFDVNEGVEAALKICNNQIKNHVTVERDLQPLAPILCAPSQLNQIFVNIINNAGQAIDGEGSIRIRTRDHGDRVEIAIRDSGCGMDEQTRAHLFEPFFTTKPIGQGTGLGLSIVYRIVEDHGGSIEIDSAPGKGSEFRISLPRRGSAAAAPQLAEAATA